MSLLKQIDQDLIKALKNRDSVATDTLRGLKSDIKYYQIEKRLDKITDEDVTAVLSSAAKRRRDSIEQFQAGGRDDLVSRESRELDIIKTYLPEAMSEEEIESAVRDAIAEAGAASPADLGKVMKILMPNVRGRADGKLVNEIVRRLLGS